MLTYISGNPGAGKTLHLIKRAFEEKTLQGRPVYYWNIRGCKVEEWTELTKDQVLKWYELPSGSVILIDEVQKVFRARGKNADVPLYIQHLEDHRHDGIDIVATSQFPLQIDIGFRRQVQKHLHFERSFGFRSYRQLSWEDKCVNDPKEDYFARKDADVGRGRLDPKYYDKYESAEVHTHKAKPPKKLIIVCLGLLLAVGAVIYVPSTLFDSPKKTDDKTVKQALEKATSGIKLAATGSPYGSELLTDSTSYLKALTPVVKDVPNSAPIYQSLHEPVSMPKLNCLFMGEGEQFSCKCYSQQATKLNISERACVDYVNNGYQFDYTKPDYSENFDVANAAQAVQGLPTARGNIQSAPKKTRQNDSLKAVRYDQPLLHPRNRFKNG